MGTVLRAYMTVTLGLYVKFVLHFVLFFILFWGVIFNPVFKNLHYIHPIQAP